MQQYDYSRGEALFTDSSDDDSTTDEEDGDDGQVQEFEWGELDADAIWHDDENQVEVIFFV